MVFLGGLSAYRMFLESPTAMSMRTQGQILAARQSGYREKTVSLKNKYKFTIQIQQSRNC